MKYFDAHSHMNFAAYDADRDETMVRTLETGVGMNIVGTQFDTSKKAVEMAHTHADTYAVIGLHPIHTTRSHHDTQELGEGNKEFTSRGEVFDIEKYVALGADPKVVAIGECGLDYYRNDPATKATQEEAFLAQIECANRLGKPLMLHVRASQGSQDAYLDALALVKAHAKVAGDVHFFAGNWETAQQWLDIGFTLSFTGVVTFTHDYDEVVRQAPLDMLLSETDAPYVTPAPYRGKRNEPAYVIEVVRAIARIRDEDEEAVRAQILKNVRRVFGIANVDNNGGRAV
jgi:TatD DNase family protein